MAESCPTPVKARVYFLLCVCVVCPLVNLDRFYINNLYVISIILFIVIISYIFVSLILFIVCLLGDVKTTSSLRHSQSLASRIHLSCFDRRS